MFSTAHESARNQSSTTSPMKAAVESSMMSAQYEIGYDSSSPSKCPASWSSIDCPSPKAYRRSIISQRSPSNQATMTEAEAEDALCGDSPMLSLSPPLSSCRVPSYLSSDISSRGSFKSQSPSPTVRCQRPSAITADHEPAAIEPDGPQLDEQSACGSSKAMGPFDQMAAAPVPVMMLMVPIATRQQYQDLLQQELEWRRRQNDELKATVDREMSRNQETKHKLKTMANDFKLRYESHLEELFNFDSIERMRVHRLIGSTLAQSPQS